MKRTKTKLVSSIVTLLVCFAMLVGSTFAWFTDSASTGVNKIQAGNLDIQLLDENGNSIEGETLSWKKANGSENQPVLWEPGVTYYTQGFQIKNAGNLALKFKISINGISGGAKLLEAIDFYLTTVIPSGSSLGDSVSSLSTEYKLGPGKYWNNSAEGIDTETNVYLVGHMSEDAGNEYKGLSIDNIGITLAATQDTVESDSFDSMYDINAVYPSVPALSNAILQGVIKANETTTLGNISDSSNPTAAQIEIPGNAVESDSSAIFKMDLTECNPDSVTYEISLNDSETNASITLNEPSKVTTNIGSGLTDVMVYHSGTEMTKSTSSSNLTNGTFYYNKTTGKLIICTTSFSPFRIEYKFDGVASVNGVAYSSLSSAIAAANTGDTVVLLKDKKDNITIKDKNIILDLNGHILQHFIYSYTSVLTIGDNANVVIKNGTIKSSKSGILVSKDSVTLGLENVYLDCGYVGFWSNSANNLITINNCKINSSYIGVNQNGSYGGNSIIIKDSYIEDTYGVGIYISNSVAKEKQNLTIDNCTVIGPTALEIKHTNANISNSALVGTATPTASGSNNNGSCTDGYAFAATTNGADDKVTGNINIVDCKFYSGSIGAEPNGYVFVYQVDDGSSVTIDGIPVSDYNTYGGESSSTLD